MRKKFFIVDGGGGGGGIRHAIIMKLAGCANCKSNSELYAAVTRCEIELLVGTRKIYIIFWRVDAFFYFVHCLVAVAATVSTWIVKFYPLIMVSTARCCCCSSEAERNETILISKDEKSRLKGCWENVNGLHQKIVF